MVVVLRDSAAGRCGVDVNQHLSDFDAVLVGAVTMEALMAVVVHLMVVRVASRLNRALSLSIAALALVYAVAYQVLLWTDVDPGGFQSVLRGIGLIAWPIVWIAPYVIRIRSKMGDQLVSAVVRELRGT